VNLSDKFDFNFSIDSLLKLSNEMKELSDNQPFYMIFNQNEIISMKNSVLNDSEFQHYKNNIVICGSSQEKCDQNNEWFMDQFNKVSIIN